MKKLLILILILLVTPVIGGLYGILHDQLTYTISPEYYTKFKFYQFGFVDRVGQTEFPYARLRVCGVGFLATWWMGIPIGLILGLVGLIHSDWDEMFTITMKAIFVTVLVAFITGVIGLLYGFFFLAGQPIEAFANWYFPNNLLEFRNFVTVGSMHNFSYIGGLLGLIAGVVYSIRQKLKFATETVAD